MSGSVAPPTMEGGLCPDTDVIFVSRYESATDAGLAPQGQWESSFPRGDQTKIVQTKWSSAEDAPNPGGQALAEAEGEGDSGFQEAGLCAGLACPPLLSPERAKAALMLGRQLLPMVGPQHSPVNEELSATYMDKARRASEYLRTTVALAPSSGASSALRLLLFVAGGSAGLGLWTLRLPPLSSSLGRCCRFSEHFPSLVYL